MEERFELEQVSIRLVRDPPLYSKERIKTPEDAIRIMGENFRDYDREMLAVVNLRGDNAPINMSIVSIGAVNQSIAHPREILKSAILSNAAYIMLFHNHPSGNLEPSDQDISFTAKMADLCNLIEIPLIDHIILGRENEYYSFREKDILPMGRMHYDVSIDDVDLKPKEKKTKKSIHKRLEKKKGESYIKNNKTGNLVKNNSRKQEL